LERVNRKSRRLDPNGQSTIQSEISNLKPAISMI